MDPLRGRRKVYAVSSPSNRTPEQPEVPPEVPPEYADAYLAGFRRGLGGVEPDAITDRVQQAPRSEPTEPVHQPEADGSGAPAEPVQHAPEARNEPSEQSKPADPTDPAEQSRPAQPERGGTDLEWLFDRRESGPPGWSTGATRSPDDEATGELPADGKAAAVASGATSVAGEGPRSPWPLLGAFLVVLLLLMLLAYLGGMAFSTIVNR